MGKKMIFNVGDVVILRIKNVTEEYEDINGRIGVVEKITRYGVQISIATNEGGVVSVIFLRSELINLGAL